MTCKIEKKNLFAFRTFSMRKSNANHDTPDGRIEVKDEEKDERRGEEDKEGLDENGIQPADVNIENVNKVEVWLNLIIKGS